MEAHTAFASGFFEGIAAPMGLYAPTPDYSVNRVPDVAASVAGAGHRFAAVFEVIRDAVTSDRG